MICDLNRGGCLAESCRHFSDIRETAADSAAQRAAVQEVVQISCPDRFIYLFRFVVAFEENNCFFLDQSLAVGDHFL